MLTSLALAAHLAQTPIEAHCKPRTEEHAPSVICEARDMYDTIIWASTNCEAVLSVAHAQHPEGFHLRIFAYRGAWVCGKL